MVLVAFEAYGCTLSYGESRRTRALAEDAGYEATDDASHAPLVVVHTCTVIGRTERSMLRRIDELAMSGRHVVVAGCLPRAHAEHVEAMSEELITPVLGQEPEDVVAVLDRVDRSTLDDPLFLPGVEAHRGSCPDPGLRTDAIVPIASGCLGRCSYCITRLAWGPLRSTPVEEVVRQARHWLGLGFREVQLTAQDTGSWGRDLDTAVALPDLVQAVAGIEDPPAEYRVRVGMLNPDSLEPILEDLSRSLGHDRVYRFVHIPVQSGSDRVLGLMGRRYGADDFGRLAGALRREVPDVTVHTDVICGFPTEEDADFDATIELLQRVRPDVVNVKAFSPRPHTEAAGMDGGVEGPVVKRRTRRASTLSEELMRGGLEDHVGEEAVVLLTEVGKPGTGTLMGRDGRYNPVVIDGGEGGGPGVGEVVRVRLVEPRGVYLLGELV